MLGGSRKPRCTGASPGHRRPSTFKGPDETPQSPRDVCLLQQDGRGVSALGPLRKSYLTSFLIAGTPFVTGQVLDTPYVARSKAPTWNPETDLVLAAWRAYSTNERVRMSYSLESAIFICTL